MFGAKYSRLKFWIISIILLILVLIATSLSRLTENSESIEVLKLSLGSSLIAFFFSLIWINTLANRIRDYASNPWISLWALIPLVNIFLALFYGIKKSKNTDSISTIESDASSLAKAVYNHSKDIASEIKPTINEYKEKHSSLNTTIGRTTDSLPNNLNEDEIYERIMIEIEEDNKIKSTWGRALAQSDGDKNKAESLYINLRVKMITNDNSLKTEENNKTNNKENMLEKILKEKNLKIKKMINDDLFLVYDISCKSNIYYLDYINEVWTVYK